MAKNWKKLNSLSPLEIFEQRVYPHIVEERGECWLVKGLKDNGHGYVAIRVLHDGVSHFYYVHRLAYELFVGEIPDGMEVCHKCDTPNCVNPKHLFLGTQKDNIEDMDKKGRRKVHRMLGETNPSTKLTKKQAEEIRKASGFHKDIAKKFGVSKQLVSAIKRNEIWK